MRLCALSVDLDEIGLYHRIHGLPPPDSEVANLVYDVAFDRWLEFAEAQHMHLTFFVVARDLLRASNAERLRRALQLGHEIGSHSLDHLYDLTRRSRAEQRQQVEGALDLFERTLGVRPQGFRAPGYTVTDGLLEVIAAAGHSYDSSVFPCPAYYAAKAAAFAALAARGRQSESILDTPKVLRAPTRPYIIDAPYYQPARGLGQEHEGRRGLVELPIQVTRGARLPYIGTGLVLAGRAGARFLTEMVIGEPLINLELHGIDLLGEDDGVGQSLRAYQPDMRASSAAKRQIFDGVLLRLRRASYEPITLRGAAAELLGA